MMQADQPPAAPAAAIVEVAPVQAAPEFFVVSRDSRNTVVTAADRPLPLVKAGRTEEALLRQALFVTATTMITRPPTDGSQPDRFRWTYQGFLQRQLCFTSMTGQFACTVAEVVALPETVTGEASLPPPPPEGQPLVVAEAQAAQARLDETLRGRAAALFDDDRRAKVDPMLKAAGVSVRRAAN
jgi:hypothetical protein